MDTRRGWRSRGYLPHADFVGLTQAITFRLADSLPAAVVESLRRQVQESASTAETRVRDGLLRERMHALLDECHGSCVLREPELRAEVERVLRRDDGVLYDLHAYVVMPNHVHVLTRVRGGTIGFVMQRWKGASAHAINQLRGVRGALWQREYFDRFIRDDAGWVSAGRYLRENPQRAGLREGEYGLWIREDLALAMG